MGALLNFILFIIIFGFIFKLLFLYVLPWFLKRKLDKMQSQSKQYYEDLNKKEGEVKVDNPDKNKPIVDKTDIGEYVDYEEVD